MAITAGLVKELREKTGAGMMDAKKALTETDGESRYRVFIDGELLKEFQNPETGKDYEPHVESLGVVDLEVGTVIRVECKPETNGKIPEGDGTAWSRGRWTKLTVEPRAE